MTTASEFISYLQTLPSDTNIKILQEGKRRSLSKFVALELPKETEQITKNIYFMNYSLCPFDGKYLQLGERN
jgi:hypothetical protein